MVKELFESKALVYYPSDKDEYQLVQKDELMVMEEMDKEDLMNGQEKIISSPKQDQVNSYDLTAS